jgi:hypothetical protein
MVPLDKNEPYSLIVSPVKAYDSIQIRFTTDLWEQQTAEEAWIALVYHKYIQVLPLELLEWKPLPWVAALHDALSSQKQGTHLLKLFVSLG